jgi:hypothetical protein
VLKSEFIKAKYSRLEFKTPEVPTGYNCPVKEGIMWKKGRDDRKFQKRKFVLSRESNTLSYYAKENVSAFKFVLIVKNFKRMLVLLLGEQSYRWQ